MMVKRSNLHENRIAYLCCFHVMMKNIYFSKSCCIIRASKFFSNSTIQRRYFQNTIKPIDLYNNKVKHNDITDDTLQRAVIIELQDLYEKLAVYNNKLTEYQNISRIENHEYIENTLFESLRSIFKLPNKAQKPLAPKSIYIWGGTGCGKTFLMDLFFECVPITRKKRIHFHDFMIDIHKRIHQIKTINKQTHTTLTSMRSTSSISTTTSVIERVAKDITKESFLICFDEFQVTDVADAMILKGLFEYMFKEGIVLIATSNRPPSDLYLNGLQRDQFLPFIAMIQQYCLVLDFLPNDSNCSTNKSIVATAVDYRRNKYEHHAKNIYYFPLDKSTREQFATRFIEFFPAASSFINAAKTHGLKSYRSSGNTSSVLTIPQRNASLRVYGHLLYVPNIIEGRRTAAFSFKDLCEKMYGPADYIELASIFHVLFLSEVPQMNLSHRNELRRFITLIDALYEKKVLLILLGDSDVFYLFNANTAGAATIHDEVFAFDRTISRLLEMQSHEYIQASFETHPQGVQYMHRIFSLSSAYYSRRKGLSAIIDISSAATTTTATLGLKQRFSDITDLFVRIFRFSGEEESSVHRDVSWVVRKCWNQYRIGTVDEVAEHIKMSLVYEENGNELHSAFLAKINSVLDTCNVKITTNIIIGSEFKQMSTRDSCEICFTDLAAYAVRLHKQHTQLQATSSNTLANSSNQLLDDFAHDDMRREIMDILLPKAVSLLVDENNTATTAKYVTYMRFSSILHRFLHRLAHKIIF